MARVKLSKTEREKIRQTVQEVERKTSGEIATAVIRESYDYAIYEMIFAILVGFIYFIIMLLFLGKIEQYLQSLFWDYSTNHLVAFYGFSLFLVITLFYFIANISYLDRLIVPTRIMKQKVKDRAVRYFMESGVHATRDRTGILIFISILEQRVELLADSGISTKIDEDRWQEIVEGIIRGIKNKNFTNSLIEAVASCGSILETYFPVKPDDKDELKNEIDILEK